MSEKRSPPKKDKAASSLSVKTPPSSSKPESKHLKRKLFIAGAATVDEEERKATTPKRRRSLHSEVVTTTTTTTSSVVSSSTLTSSSTSSKPHPPPPPPPPHHIPHQQPPPHHPVVNSPSASSSDNPPSSLSSTSGPTSSTTTAVLGSTTSTSVPTHPSPAASTSASSHTTHVSGPALSPCPLTPGGGGNKAPGRHAPLSERQQIAKIMQQYADEESKQTGDLSPPHSMASPPMSAGKRTPFDKKVTKRNEKGETRLHYAAIKGDVKLTKKLIKSGAVVNEKDNAGWTPLHEACNRGHLHVAKHLLKNGANINVLGLENDTPLHDAAINGHLKLIELLLRHGANPLQCNAAGKTPIDVAANETVLKLLKSETIASCSSSESVTSEVRSPTSPESNPSDDEREDDAKRRKDSPVSEHSSLFMPRSSNMISNIGGSAPSTHSGQGSSSSHSPTSTTTPGGATGNSANTTPSKVPAVDPYAYHDENEDSDVNTGHLPCSSTTPVRSRPLSNIHVARTTAADKAKGLGMSSYSHHHKKSAASSPKRGATSQLHHEEPSKKPKMFGSLFHGDRDKTTGNKGGKFSTPSSSSASSSSSSSAITSASTAASSSSSLEVSVGSAALQMRVSPTLSQSSQDSDLYDPQLSGEASSSSSKPLRVKDTPSVSPLVTGKVSSSDSVSTDNNRSQKVDRHGGNNVTTAGGTGSSRYHKNTPDNNTLQPDSQMPKLSQESGTFTPSRLSEDDNFGGLSDSDDNPLHIDVDSTTTSTTNATTPNKSVSQKRSIQQSKHIPSSTSKYQATSAGHKSDVSSSNFGSSILGSSDSKMLSSSSQQSPQTTGDTSPYHFTDSPCSVTTLSYKQERVERNKEAAAAAASSGAASSASASVTSSTSSSRFDKQGELPSKRPAKTDKLSSKSTKESPSTAENVGQSDLKPQSGKLADSTVSAMDRVPGSSGKTSDGYPPKADTTSVVVKQEIKEEVGSSHSTNTSASTSSSIQDDKVDLKPLTIKIEKEAGKAFKHESERSKSPKGYDSGGSSRRNSPKLVDPNRASPKSFSFKDTFPSNSSGITGKSGLPGSSKWDLSNRSSPKSDRDSPKSDKSDSSSNGGAPKVPPLKIILPPKATSTTDRPQSTKVTTQLKGNLPYVLNPTQDSAGGENAIDSSSFVTSASLATSTALVESSAAVSPLSIKPSRNSSRASSIASGEQEAIEKASSSSTAVPIGGGVTGQVEDPSHFGGIIGGNNSSSGSSGGSMGGGVSSTQDQAPQNLKRLTRSRQLDREVVRSNDEDSRDSKPDTRSEAGGEGGKEDVSERRITRSQMRSQHHGNKDRKDGNGSGNRDGGTGRDERGEEKEAASVSVSSVSGSTPAGDSSTTKSSSSSLLNSQPATTVNSSIPSLTVTGQPALSSPGNSTVNSTTHTTSSSHVMSIQHPHTSTSDDIVVHPRKRKALRQRANQEQSCTVDTSFNLFPKNNTSEKTANPYEMFLDIRKRVAQRRNDMTVVTPKAPTGFSNYLMVSCKYILQGKTTTTTAATATSTGSPETTAAAATTTTTTTVPTAPQQQNIPMLPTPASLADPMKELFVEQERTRYKLRLQHMIEREKLRLSIEQEVLRVHGRAARALANQTTPLSVCAILKDEEIYNVIDPEAEEKDKIGARSRYTGRQFLSWLQDVDTKYEKIKESLLMRHHHEAESLHAVQKLEWEWKLKEATLCDYNKTPVVDNTSVPMVMVNDDFELLPS